MPITNKKITVCIDPGHGVESGNASPDGAYYEHEFTFDLAKRIRGHLERCGVSVVLTRQDEHCPTGKANSDDLICRAQVSNKAGADLFLSLHSNAHASDGWGTARGLELYTISGPLTAKRNVAAVALINRFHEAGVILRADTPKYANYSVLRNTSAPAVLIEYGFHTNKEDTALLSSDTYRNTLAVATAKAVCDATGAVWADEKKPGKEYDPVPDWALEGWTAACGKGVLDGTRPTDPVTRQEFAVVLKRLNLV